MINGFIVSSFGGKLIMALPDGAIALGNYFYLFQSTVNTTDCIISSHGGFISENRSFNVPPGVVVNFYGPHGAVLMDPGLENFVRHVTRADAEEGGVFRSGDSCRNYLLTKYQGAHAGESGVETVETYAGIIKSVRGEAEYITKKKAALERCNDKMKPFIKQELKNTLGASVLTIRNRWDVNTGMPLESAIKAAKKAMPSLTTFHCAFCRSKYGVKNPPEHTISYRQEI